jgi:hypothetical protein
VLAPAALAEVAAALAAEGDRAAPVLRTTRLVRSLGEVAASWVDPDFPLRRAAQALLAAATGYAPAMIAEALDRLFHSLRAEALDELLRAEVGHLHCRPPELVLHIAAGTVFPPAVVGATCALLLRSPVLVKPASSEPFLAALWARSLAARDPGLARLVAVLPWPRTRTDLTQAALAAADAVVAHGDDSTIDALRAAVRPATRFVAHGHRVSGAILCARALAIDGPRLARLLARDVAFYDQQGCLSPHTVFIEATPALPPRAFADLLAAELEALAAVWPRAALDAAAASALRQILDTRELDYAARAVTGDSRAHLLGGFDAGWAVLLDPAPGFEHSPLGRTVIVKPVSRVADAIEALGAVRQHLQAVGIALAHRDRLALARSLGLYDDVETNLDWAPRVRLCPLGTMQSPPLTWSPDGVRPLGSLCPLPPAR